MTARWQKTSEAVKTISAKKVTELSLVTKYDPYPHNMTPGETAAA